MCCSALAHASLSFFVRLGATRYHFPPLATLFIRSIMEGMLSFSYVFAFVDYRRSVPAISRSQWFLIFLRSLVGTLSLLSQITALGLISMGNSVTILFTCPAITMAMAALVIHEPIRRIDVVALIMSFAGVVFVAQPSFLFANHPSSTTHQSMVGVLVALSAAFFSSSVSVITRFLGHDVHFMINVCALSICTFLTAITLSGANEFHSITTNHTGLLVNIIAGICGALAQSTLSKSLQWCRAGPALLVRSLTIPFSYTYGLLFLGESPSLLTLFGVFMILSAATALALSQVFAAKPLEETTPLTQQGSNFCTRLQVSEESDVIRGKLREADPQICVQE
ncbi:solute carrier family 35 member G1 [Gracilaria domingensis]|nr:solute carrier family 35 member G1 [Gracilaria domingensis]